MAPYHTQTNNESYDTVLEILTIFPSMQGRFADEYAWAWSECNLNNLFMHENLLLTYFKLEHFRNSNIFLRRNEMKYK